MERPETYYKVDLTGFPDEFISFFNDKILHPFNDGEKECDCIPKAEITGDYYDHYVFGYWNKYLEENIKDEISNELKENDGMLTVYTVSDSGDSKKYKDFHINLNDWLFFGCYDLEEESEYYAVNVGLKNLQDSNSRGWDIFVYDHQGDHKLYTINSFIEWAKGLENGNHQSVTESFREIF